nr:glucose-6-phosphate isomerase [Pseudoxanthomonas mexicana]
MSQGFDALQSHATRLRGAPLSDLLAREPERVAAHAVRSGPLYFNFARQSYDASAWQALVEHARQADLAAAFRRLFDGEKVNVTEDRAALHTALRGRHSDTAIAREAHESALQVRGR